MNSFSLAVLSRGENEGLLTQKEVTATKEFFRAAVVSMAFSGGGNTALKPGASATGPVLPRTSSGFVGRGESTAGNVTGATQGVNNTFKNLRPTDPIRAPSTQSVENIQSTNQSGRFNYVVTEKGQLVLGRNGTTTNRTNGHIDLAQGRDVIAAGEARFVNGQLRYIDNNSGHYKPSGEAAKQSALKAFEQFGARPRDGYIERKF